MRPRGPKPAIPTELWPVLRAWKEEGISQRAMVQKLAAEHGIEVSDAAVSRCFFAMREQGMVETPAKPEPMEISDADEVKEIRRVGRRILYSDNEFAALAAGKLLLTLQDRGKKAQPAESVQPAQPSLDPAALSPEDEALAVQRLLGKRALA